MMCCKESPLDMQVVSDSRIIGGIMEVSVAVSFIITVSASQWQKWLYYSDSSGGIIAATAAVAS